jgi:hypothetical protein
MGKEVFGVAIDCLITTTDVETVTFGVMIIVFVEKHADVCHQSVVLAVYRIINQSIN